jgi:CBS domain containing-hemolysin-like protein
MDGILGVYMAALVLCSCQFLARWPEHSKLSLVERLACPLLLAVICGVKNEGLVIGLLYLLTFTTVLFLNKYPRAVIARFVAASAAAFVPVMIWKIRLVSAHINNDLVEERGGTLRE